MQQKDLDLLSLLVNTGRSDEVVTNSRGQNLHVRTVWRRPPPAAGGRGQQGVVAAAPPKAVVLVLHGYGSHGNRPAHRYLASALNEAGFACVTLDFHGHGYSEGVRGLVTNHADLVDDVMSVLATFDGGLPIYLMGHSMGGGVAIAVSELLKHQPRFRGLLLLCPVVRLAAAPPLLTCCLLGGLVRIFGQTASLPEWLVDENAHNHMCWASEAYSAYVVGDGFPGNPQGLSYGGNMQFATLRAVVAGLAPCVQRAIFSLSCPFVVFHDPQDAIVPIRGSHELIVAATAATRQLVEVPGGLHDLLANKAEYMSAACVRWLIEEEAKSEKKRRALINERN